MSFPDTIDDIGTARVGPTEPVNAANGELWIDTSAVTTLVLRARVAGVWVALTAPVAAPGA